MATQSNVPVTSGSGNNIDTVTTATAGNKRGVVAIGDPSVDAGLAPVDATLGVSVNLKGANGIALDTNDGASSAGTTRVTISNNSVPIGALTEVAPATDTASSGLNGRLQRLAQRLTSLIGQLPAALVGGRLDVNVGNTPTVNASNTAGDTASGTTDAGNPVKVGFVGKTALPTAITDGQRINSMSDKFGRQVVLPNTIRDLVGTQTTTISTTTETTIVTAAVGIFNDLILLVISNTSATNVRVDFRDTTAGTILFSIFVPATDTRGFSIGVPVPQTTANTNWTATLSAAVTDVRIYAVFAKNK